MLNCIDRSGRFPESLIRHNGEQRMAVAVNAFTDGPDLLAIGPRANPGFGSGVILGGATRPGRPISAGKTDPTPLRPATTGPSKREKSRCEWRPSQSARLKRYLARARRSGVAATWILAGGAMAGRRAYREANLTRRSLPECWSAPLTSKFLEPFAWVVPPFVVRISPHIREREESRRNGSGSPRSSTCRE